jgi:DNA-binding NarL/FixJ family response regulator
MTAIRALLADDQALVRRGLRTILEAEPDLEIVGEAADGVEAVALARRRAADIVLMDVRMPHMDGLAATRLLAHPATGAPIDVLVVTTFDHDEVVFAALRAGASGFLLKSAEPDAAIAGELVLEASTVKKHVANVLSKVDLTSRAQAVVYAYEHGLTRPGS